MKKSRIVPDTEPWEAMMMFWPQGITPPEPTAEEPVIVPAPEEGRVVE